MKADLQLPGPVTPAQWDLCEDQPVERSPKEKARILVHLQCLLAEARAMNGVNHANA